MRARLHFVEQPHVLDRDHRLVGEVSSTSSICLSVNGRTVLRDSTITPIGSLLSQQWDAEHCAKAAKPLASGTGVFRIGQDIGDLNDATFCNARPTSPTSLDRRMSVIARIYSSNSGVYP